MGRERGMSGVRGGGRGTIVYAGGFVLPSGNASAQRALENARLFRSLGYEVVLLGKLPDDAREATIDGLRCLSIRSPDGGRWRHYKDDAGSVIAAIEQIGVENVHSLIVYNYPAWPLTQLIAYGRRHGVPIVLELTEWYSWEGSSVLKNLRRIFESEYRMRMLAPLAGNLLCTSDWGTRRYRSANAMTLPWIIDETAPKWAAPPWPRSPGRRRFVYVGSPGAGLVKDYLHLAIAALARLARGGADFDFQVAGMTGADLLKVFPGLAADIEALGERITFHGRLPHDEALGLLKSADFSLFVRPDNRVSRFGFPTKVAEAFAAGVPTITTPTSDIPKYVRDGETGILLAGTDEASIAEGLARALALSDEALAAMKARCRTGYPFAPARFAESMRAFLERVRR